jgi:SAM-dependent methyltransferase
VSTTQNPAHRGAGAEPAPAPTVFFDARAEFAARFLTGEGIEIGPLHQPLRMPPHAQPRYVDRLQVDDLRREYPELAEWDLTEVDIVDDGEELITIPEASQDFIVANHFLEHCEDPIRTIETHLGKLRPGGVLFYAVPDRRFTFDFRRPPTPLEHMVADYEEGPARSRKEHYDDWARLVIDGQSPHANSGDASAQEEWAEDKARELEAAKYSIHMHVWTQEEFLQLLLHCRRRFEQAFDVEAAARQAIEFVVVLRKRGRLPEPPAEAPSAPQPAPRSLIARSGSCARAVVHAAREKIRQRGAQP